ncbi:ribosome biogenesis protein NOP53 [Passerculus sandwichensis]
MAAAESFLAFNPAGAAAASRRRCRGPRNRKKGWKRWSGPEARLGREIGDFLEDVGLQERAAGGLISEQPNEGLFFLDKGTTPKRKKKPPQKPLHVDLVLQPLSKVPPPKKCRSGGPKARTRGVPRGPRDPQKEPETPRDPQKEPRDPQKEPERGRSDPQRGFYDIWGEHNPLDAPLAGQDPWYLQQTKRLRVQRPPRLQARPSPLPPVEVIGQGGSYNPPFQEHQELLRKALEVELRRKREEEKVERRLKVTEAPPSQEAVLREQLQGLLEEDEDGEGEGEDEEGQQQPEDEERGRPQRREQPGRKTEKQRRREKEQREKAGARARARQALQRRQGLFQLRSLRRSLQLRGGIRDGPVPVPVPAWPCSGARGCSSCAPCAARCSCGVGSGMDQGWINDVFMVSMMILLGSPQAGARARARLALQRRQGLFQLRSLRRSLQLRELELRRRRLLRERLRRLRETAPKRLGRLRYEEPELELQLSEEIPECLRSLRPEGNLLRDRFRSLQRRNILEPRLRAKFKRRYKVKYVEKRSFRAVTL